MFNRIDPMKQICQTPSCIKSAATILQYMNKTADPCDDFFEFACGTFVSTTSIPDDKAEVSQFSIVDEHLQEQLRILVEEPVKAGELKPFVRVKEYYKLCMDLEKIEKNGLGTIKGMVQELGGWPVVVGSEWSERDFDWKKVMYQMRHMALGDNHIISTFFDLDDNNSTRRVLKVLSIIKYNLQNINYFFFFEIKVDQAGLNLSRKILLKAFNDTLVKAYYEYLVDVAVIFGAERLRAQRELKEVVEFEIKLANVRITKLNFQTAFTHKNIFRILDLSRSGNAKKRKFTLQSNDDSTNANYISNNTMVENFQYHVGAGCYS